MIKRAIYNEALTVRKMYGPNNATTNYKRGKKTTVKTERNRNTTVG